jgi:hypothetical protein
LVVLEVEQTLHLAPWLVAAVEAVATLVVAVVEPIQTHLAQTVVVAVADLVT